MFLQIEEIIYQTLMKWVYEKQVANSQSVRIAISTNVLF